jgi:hypothetical protein
VTGPGGGISTNTLSARLPRRRRRFLRPPGSALRRTAMGWAHTGPNADTVRGCWRWTGRGLERSYCTKCSAEFASRSSNSNACVAVAGSRRVRRRRRRRRRAWAQFGTLVDVSETHGDWVAGDRRRKRGLDGRHDAAE